MVSKGTPLHKWLVLKGIRGPAVVTLGKRWLSLRHLRSDFIHFLCVFYPRANPLLKTGITLAIFNWCGTMPVVNERWFADFPDSTLDNRSINAVITRAFFVLYIVDNVIYLMLIYWGKQYIIRMSKKISERCLGMGDTLSEIGAYINKVNIKARRDTIDLCGQSKLNPTQSLDCSYSELDNGSIPRIKTKGIKFAHLNIHSLVSKIDELQILLKHRPFDVICLNETLYDSSI